MMGATEVPGAGPVEVDLSAADGTARLGECLESGQWVVVRLPNGQKAMVQPLDSIRPLFELMADRTFLAALRQSLTDASGGMGAVLDEGQLPDDLAAEATKCEPFAATLESAVEDFKHARGRVIDGLPD